ncbi:MULTISPECIES: hypothetical protein [Spirulina sp. CCY15215]|uniref:hypothetical protein n=1 Tax=Spirulina sp. CCY15215 TaxID=2767591 RepID=UPI00194E5B07|nr:hypothetical protein [Spirulina major]
MPPYTIALTEEVYEMLLAVAREQGLTPANWIAVQLPVKPLEKQPLPEGIEDLIGAINSQAKPYHQFPKTEFGEQITAKLAKQGLRRSQS